MAPPATQLYETWASTFCDIVSSCNTGDEDLSVYALMAKADKGACRTYLTFSLENERPQANIETAIAEGRVVYHGEQVGACMAAAKSQCNLELSEVSACAAVLEGTVATGGECWMREECAGEAYCSRSDSDCPGTCQPLPLRGESCNYAGCSQSEGKTACGGDDTCVPWDIVEGVAEGESCASEYNATDAVSRRCAAGLYCAHDWDAGTAVCRALAAAGESCDDAECSTGLLCLASGDGKTCVEVGVVSSAGATCNESDQSQPFVACNVFGRLACEAGTCQALGDGSIGSACSTRNDADGLCRYGSYCDEDTSVCTAVKADGEACRWDSECASGRCDFGGSGVCVAAVCE